MRKLSIIIPVYNERATVAQIIERVKNVDLGIIEKEIIVVDDGSSDGSQEILDSIPNIKLAKHATNSGKGSAIRTGLASATGDFCVIQDADLEYDPNDFKNMIAKTGEKVGENEVDVVYGSRRLPKPGQVSEQGQWYYYLGGVYLTSLANLLYGTHITDEPTCYKMFKTDLIKSLKLEATGFEFCPEVTAKVARKGIEIHEVPISYHPRTASEGKKIKLKDALIATWVLVKNKFSSPS